MERALRRKSVNKKKRVGKRNGADVLNLMMLPGTVLLLIYSYIPMMGIYMAFTEYMPSGGMFGSKFVGLDNFRYIFSMPDFCQVLYNTVIIAFSKLVLIMIIPVLFAILLNEVSHSGLKRTVQTAVYLPHFLSWVILGSVLIDILSPSKGLVNEFIKKLGCEPIFFLGDNAWFRKVVVITNVWKEFGWSSIVFLAAMTNIDPTLYEAAMMDGAGRIRQTLMITLPGIVPVLVLVGTLNLGNILNAGFDQVYILYSPAVYKTGDILDTLVYRTGMESMQFSVATAMGMFKSVVSFLFVFSSYKLAYKFADYRIF